MTYAIVLGLVGVSAIAAVNRTTDSLVGIFDDVNAVLDGPARYTLVRTDENGPITVSGPGVPSAGTAVVLTLTNVGDLRGTQLSPVGFTPLDGPIANGFVVDEAGGGNTCLNKELQSGAACQIYLRASAEANGSFSTRVTLGDSETRVSLVLSGQADTFNPSILSFTPDNLTTVQVAGTGTLPVFGADLTFVLTNSGDLPSATLATPILETTTATPGTSENFILVSETCTGTALAPGATCSVVVRPQVTSEISGGSAPLAGQLSVAGVSATFSGTATSFAPGALSLSPSSVSDTNVVGNGTLPATGSSLTFTLTNTGDLTTDAIGAPVLETVTATPGSSSNYRLVSTTCGGAPLPSGGDCTVTVTPEVTAGIPGGSASFSGRLTVGGLVSTLSGNASGLAPGAVSANTSSLSNLNTTGPGAGVRSTAQTITLTNTGQLNLTNFSISFPSGGESFEVSRNTCTSVPAGGSCQVDVQAVRSANGSYSGTLRISHNGNGSSGSADISLSGTSSLFNPPQVSLSVASGNANAINDTRNGSGTVVTFRVTNVGETATGNVGASTNSGQFIVSESCGVLQAGGSCTFTVQSSFNSNGSRSATLTVSANPGGSASLTISGSGSGFTTSCGGLTTGFVCNGGTIATRSPDANNLAVCQNFCGSNAATCCFQDLNICAARTGSRSASGVTGTDFNTASNCN